MLSSPSVAGRPARPSLRVWGSVDGPSCRAEPRGRGVFNMGLGKLEEQGPRASFRQSIHSNGHGCDQTQGGVLSLFGEPGNPRFRPEHPGPWKPELQPHRPSQFEPSARRRHPRFCRLSEFIGWSGKGMVHQASQRTQRTFKLQLSSWAGVTTPRMTTRANRTNQSQGIH